MVFEDVCDVGLGLALGCEGKLENQSRTDQQRQIKKPCVSFDNLFPPSNSTTLAATTTTTVLTLGISDETSKAAWKIDVNKGYPEPADLRHHRQISPHSAVSSFSNGSVKRERDPGSEELELEKVSSRVSDEDEVGTSSSRKKLRLTKDQSALLEDSFKEHNTLNPKQKQALAKQLNLRPRQVEVWFQNRRARTKLKQTEVDCELLKKCCESLTDENRRLQKELRELKALKLAPPLYMQLPAATLTMCPSCERIGGARGGVDGSSKVPYTMASKPHFYNPFTNPSAAC